MDFDEFKNVLN